ncbi:MAG: hypothetical protein JSW26_17580 [Desulfobacterales bacterium]|nr:MAG: hypothetical protein JSW26_17580 [Desulfobacterales bacterium]
MFNINEITRRVLHNCDISDAHHAGMYSICGLALRLRDLYKWEQGLPPWEERESAEVLEWIEAKENKWDTYADTDFWDISINGKKFDPFDTVGINSVLEPHNFLYGAGYARSLKPTFFLAAIEEKSIIDGTPTYTLGREAARDLLTIPALSQDDCVLLRQESARLFLWDSIFYIKKSARPALNFALDRCGIKDQQPKALRRSLADILAVQKATYIYHEIGELKETVFDRALWREIIAAFPYSPVEYLARAVKDLLADTNDFGTLHHIVRERKTAALAFYVAFLDGLVKEFFPELPTAFEDFTETNDWSTIEQALSSGYKTAAQHAGLIMNLYREGVHKNDLKWAEAQIQKRLLGKYTKNRST